VSDAATGRAHARAALLGNPSDGYGGAVIALAFSEFAAEVQVGAGEGVEGPDDAKKLVRAASKRFFELPEVDRAPLEAGLRIACRTTIPREVGLGGSSAIVIATLLALAELTGATIELAELPSLALACETEELGIAAGLQDRVAQAYGGLVHMDLAPELVTDGHGRYEPLDPTLLPELFVAWREDAPQPSGDAHRQVRERFQAGDPEVVGAMEAIAALARQGREALRRGDRDGLGRLMERNVELRRSVFELDPRHLRMIETAAQHGAPANYAGSGGAIVGLLPEGGDSELARALADQSCRMVLPTPAPAAAALRSTG
jgi:glucuronokinase